MSEKYVVRLKNAAIYHADNPFGSTSAEKLMRRGEMVLSDVNLCVAPGEFVYLIGRVGSGKSTLLKTLYAEVQLLSGEGRVAGYDLRRLRRRDIPYLRRRIGIVFQDYQLLTDRNVFMNLYYVMKATGWKREDQIRERIDQVLKLVDLGAKSYKMPFELSGGEQQRLVIARALLSDPQVLLADEPTNHLDADSIEWLRGFLKKYEGGFLVISHSTELLDEVVNKVWHLDAQTGQIDMYSLGWKAYLHQRVVDEERRRREREVAEKKADRLMKQGIRLHAKASKAVAAQNMMRRAERLLSETSDAQKQDKVADIRFPEPAPCGRTPIMAKDISKAYGSNIVFAGVNLAVDKGSRVVILGYNGAGKTTTLRLLAHIDDPDTGVVEYGHGCKIGYFAQEHDTLDLNATVLENLTHVAPELNDTQARSILGFFLFSGDDAFKPARVLSGGEKTRLALATLVTSRANVLLLDEPTNNLDPASRDEILKAIAKYEGAIVLVTHDEGAVQALNPERVLLMPDGDEDLWNDSYLDLVAEE